MKDEREILELIGRFYVERNIYWIRPYLHSNIVYFTKLNLHRPIYTGETSKSLWKEIDIRGAKGFLKHFTEQFKMGNEIVHDYVVSPLRFKEYDFIILKTADD